MSGHASGFGQMFSSSVPFHWDHKIWSKSQRTTLPRRSHTLIVTGDGTGQAIAPETIARLRSALPNSPLVREAVSPPERVPMGIDAAIVDTYLHEDSDISRPVCATHADDASRSRSGREQSAETVACLAQRCSDARRDAFGAEWT